MRRLNDYTDTLTSALFENNGAFFAFGNKQFDEKKKEGVVYTSLMGGLVCPKGNAKKLMTDFERIFDDAVRQQVKDYGATKIIRYEYFNYETQITGDNQQVIDGLATYKQLFPELFTNEIILAVCQKCFAEAIKNDLF